MTLIDPFDFRDMFRTIRSIAMVGNAPSILERDHGATIDAADLVVRFNRARTGGLEKAIGSRTDVLFVNASNSLAKAPPPDQLSRPRCLVCFVSPNGVRTLDVGPFREWAGDVPVLFTFGPDLIGLPALARQRPLTSGTYALFTLLRLLEVDRLFVTGFTMFGAVAGGAGKYWNEATPPAAVVHDLDQEAALFTAVLSQYQGRLDVTDEVRELLARNGLDVAVGAVTDRRPGGRSRLQRRIAEGLAWRVLRAGMALRRAAESK